MRIDLAKVHARSLQFIGHVPLKNGFVDELWENAPPTGKIGEALLFPSTYKKGATQHWCMGTLNKPTGDISASHIIFRYSTVPLFRKPPKEVPSTDRLIEFLLLGAETDEILTSVSLRLEYPPTPNAEPLPLEVSFRFQGELPFDEIRGFRFVKQTKGTDEYSVIVDLVDNGSISHAITFQMPVKLSRDMPKEILKRGVAISRRFIPKT